MRTAVALAVCLAHLASTGCATIAHGRSQQVAITSEPPGAQVLIENRQVGLTPVQVKLSRRRSGVVVRFQKEGFTPQDVALVRKGSAWLIGDAAFAAAQFANQGLTSRSGMARAAATVLGVTAGIDLLTGAAFTLPREIHVTLQPAAPRP